MFGRNIKIGMSTLSLPNEAVNDFETEEELEALLHTIKNRRYEVGRHDNIDMVTDTRENEL